MSANVFEHVKNRDYLGAQFKG